MKILNVCINYSMYKNVPIEKLKYYRKQLLKLKILW